MRKHTDSAITEYHEDGSWTTTIVETNYPATRGQKAAAWAGLGSIFVLPFVPVVALVISEKLEERREKRRDKKSQSETTTED